MKKIIYWLEKKLFDFYQSLDPFKHGNKNYGNLTEQNNLLKTNHFWTALPLTSAQQLAYDVDGGEGMQQVQAIKYAPSNPSVVYLSVDTSQVWRSGDGGDSWQMKHTGFTANGGAAIAVDPNNEDIVLVAGFVGKERASVPESATPVSGIFRTIDGGENWVLVKELDFYDRLQGDLITFINSDIVFCGTYKDGLFISVDGGLEWEQTNFISPRISDIKMHPGNETTLYICSSQGLVEYNWMVESIIERGIKLPDYPRMVVVDNNNPNVMYVTVGAFGVYKSVDGGVTFNAINTGLVTTGKEYRNLAISKVNPNILYVSPHKWSKLNPFFTLNGGATWIEPTTIDEDNLSLIKGRFFSANIEPHPVFEEVALTCANGNSRIIKTENRGYSWKYSGSGFLGGRMIDIAWSGNINRYMMFLTDFGPILTENEGQSWELLFPSPSYGGATAGDVDWDSGYIYTAKGVLANKLINVSKNMGQTWEEIPGTNDFYSFIKIHPQNSNIIYAQGWKSYNKGNDWQKLDKKVMGMFPGNGQVVYAYEDIGSQTQIFKSIDGGRNWAALSDPINVRARGINGIEVDPTNQDLIYIPTAKGIFIYDGAGWSLKGVSSGLLKDDHGMVFVNNIAIDPNSTNIIYATRRAPNKGHSSGVYRSNDYGISWENITDDLTLPITIWSAKVNPHNSKVFIGSSHGTWIR
jgi:photosystem II stability/assembly factor-like uncharacterized protein